MQRTTDSVKVLVGAEKRPIILTDSAVGALQGEAAGDARKGIDSVIDTATSADMAAMDLGDLLELRDHLTGALDAVEVLIECRPLDEIHADD